MLKNFVVSVLAYIVCLSTAANNQIAGRYLIEMLADHESSVIFWAEQLDLFADNTFSSLTLMGPNLHPRNDDEGSWHYEQGRLQLSSHGDVRTYLIDMEGLELNNPSPTQGPIERRFDDGTNLFITRIDENQERFLNDLKIESTASHLLSDGNKSLRFISHDVRFLMRLNEEFFDHETLVRAASSIKEIEMPIIFPDEMTNRKLVYFGKGYPAEHYEVNFSDTHLLLSVWGVLQQKIIWDCRDTKRSNCENFLSL